MSGRMAVWGVALVGLVLPLAASADDWPMYNHDPALTGRTSEYVTGTLTKKWERQFPTAAHVRAQPVIVSNVIYQGWMDGTLRALNINTGADIWSVSTGGVILSSACVVRGRVVVAVYFGDRGELRGYDTAGNLQWKLATDALVAPPIAYQDRIYVGSTDATVYCVNALSGVLWWKTNLGGRVLGPVACKNNIVVAQADDMVGYAMSATNGAILWRANLPGEWVGHAYPVIGRNTVFFTTAPRANSYAALDGELPHQPEHVFGFPPWGWAPKKTLAQVISETQTLDDAHPEAGTTLAVDLSSGIKKFPTPLATPYWGMLTPVMLTDNLLLKHCWQGVLSVDVDSGAITLISDATLLLRNDEYAYGIVGGGQRFYGAIADDLGVENISTRTVQTLVGAFYTHGVTEWAHVPDSVNQYMATAGPGDGNSGYATTPIPYAGKFIWQYCGSWLRCDQGTAGQAAPSIDPLPPPTDSRTSPPRRH